MKVAALALSPWLLIDGMASCYIHLLAEMLCWPGAAREVLLDALSNVADKSFAVEITLPRLADRLEDQVYIIFRWAHLPLLSPPTSETKWPSPCGAA